MNQARRPAGTPVGGQFAPTIRPEATGIELVDDAGAAHRRVKATVAAGIPSFSVEGIGDGDCRTTRDRVRAAMLSSGLSWPMGKISVLVTEPAPERTADLDLEIALSVLQASGQLPDVSLDGLRGELGLDGSIRGEATTVARNLRQLVDSLKTGSGERGGGGHGPTSVERCEAMRSAATVIAALVDELGDEVPERAVEAIEDAEELLDAVLDELQAKRDAVEQRLDAMSPEPGPGPSSTTTETAHTAETARTAEMAMGAGTTGTEAAGRNWRLFRESYGGWLDQYRKSRQIGGRGETERRLREAAGLADVSNAQLRADKARAYRGETSEQILEGR